jgi:hypothetical protein
MRYYIVDYGKEMIEAGKQLCDYLERNKFHYVVYLTNADGLLCCEEIDEDEFLNHFNYHKKTE